MNNHYDVGMVGVWFGANYGSLINGYAIFKVLKNLGKSVLLINKHSAVPDGWNNIINSPVVKSFVEEFYSDDEVTPLMPFDDLRKLNDICDCFLAGSDQIWSFWLNRTFNYSFMLNFADDHKKKISFGTSFGPKNDTTPPEQYPIVKNLLDRFDAISVREQSGANICRDRYSIKADVTVEPVFCLTIDEYCEIAERSEINETEPYILTYILDPTPEKIEAVKCYCDLRGMKSINILDCNPSNYVNARKISDLPNTLEYPKVEDFIKLYLNSWFVITDSFHGTCFSMIFNKPFLAIANLGRGIDRFTYLLGKFGLLDRLVNDPKNIPLDENYFSPIDYNRINELIAKERKSSVNWLKNVLETPKEKLPSIILPASVAQAVKPEICTGCGACASICPTAAIAMLPDSEGFLKPMIDSGKCNRCGLCVKKCIAINPARKNFPSPECWAMMANDEIRKMSSSGGMFTVAAEHIINLGGYVCGAAYRVDFSVEHIIVHDINELYRLRGSKYIQSRADDAYPEVKKLLEGGASVLFTGMPCQVAGLYSYLGKEYENLYTIDLLCHGITSFKVFEKYKKDVLGERELTRLEFKAKEPWGWHAGVNAYFTDGTKYSQPLESDPYYIAYLNSISKNTACGACSVNRLPRQGDMTIGDFWGIAKYDTSMFDNKGTSVVLLNSEKGKKLFGELREKMASSKQEPLNVAIGGNHSIEHPYPLNKNRRAFFENFDKLPFEALASGCFKNRLYEQWYMELIKTVPKEDHEFYYIAKLAAENSKGRKIVTWIRSAKFERILKQYFGLTVAFGVTMRKEAVQGDYIRNFSELKGKCGQYYIVSLDRAYDEESFRMLTSFGYKEIADFVYRCFKPIVLENYDLSKGNYYDRYGNTIEGFNAVLGKVVFRGFNNHIVLGKNIPTAGNLSFDFCANGYVEIGENTRFNDICKIEQKGFNGASYICIGADCRFTNFLFRLFNDINDSSIRVGDFCTFERNLEFHANSGKKIIIGRDCMFSHDIDLWSGDGHSIFDVKTGENINSIYENQPVHRNQIVIGEHVWVGKGTFIMHGTNIGNGSIVGAKSVVKGFFPNNCSIAGNPASQVRSDVAWSRDLITDDIGRCGSAQYVWGYAQLTSSAKPAISGLNVLVIGGTRFMGICLVNELINLGNRVTIATRGKTRDSFGMKVSRIVMDVSDAESVKCALNGKYFDVIFDNLAYCSKYADNVISNVKCGKYVQLSSIESYLNLSPDTKENAFDPYDLPLELCNVDVGYQKGKRQAEALVYQKYKNIPAVTIRIPYVTKTDRLYYYCKNIVKQIPMNIADTAHGFTFIRDSEVGKFLPWIAAQNFSGPINLASEGSVTIREILDYIEKKTLKKAVIDTDNGAKSPFHEFNENTFSLNMDKAKNLGYHTSNLHDWFWKLMDEYIARAVREGGDGDKSNK